MSDQQRAFEAETRLVKASKLMPDLKHEEQYRQPVVPPKLRIQRNFTRETVARLIDWLKQE